METLSLNGAWQVKQQDAGDVFTGQVPGTIHTDLLAAGRIDDPYYRDNEMAQQWIEEKDWVYSRTFTVPAALLAEDRVLLRCEGLDTLATVTINGTEIAKTDNQYRTWEFDVKDVLVAGENRIEVYFASTLPYIAEREAARSQSPWTCAPHEKKGRSHIRKMPSNYGWDWGPALVACGIWRPISLVAFSTARLSDVYVRQDHSQSGQVTLDTATTAETTRDTALTAKIKVSYEGNVIAETTCSLTTGANSKLKTQNSTLTVSDPRLWWPNGLGEQPLYQVEVTLEGEGTILDSWQRRIGLRTLKLDRHPDQWGESFQFTANGVPFFAKGGNWIPDDALYTRTTPERLRGLLQSCVDANMNMLRIWGGGLYEADEFYDICDELGLCLWQDFIFACALYPADDPVFLENVRAEAEDNVRRLRHHASLCLWCGNNELESAKMASDDPTLPLKMRWADYKRLFDELLPGVVAQLDPETDYWPSSPHSPGDKRENADDPTCGDTHIWAVWHGRQPFEYYRTCEHRFNSEFGFQSFPEPLTSYAYTEPEDRNVTAYVMEHHQRCGPGNTIIMQYLLDWFRLPTSYEMSLWLSQILQGMAMKYAIEHWRRSMPRGMGTLYWQINDNWPVASWASLDYFGRWKALHYMARAFYAPLLVSAVEDLEAGMVEIHLTNDLRAGSAGEVRWQLITVAGETVDSGRFDARIAALSSAKVATLDLKAQLAQHGPRNLLLAIDYLVDGQSVSSNLTHFVRPKHVNLQEPGITLQVEPRDDRHAVVTLNTEKPAMWAWLSLDGVGLRGSANYLHLLPGAPVTVEVETEGPVSVTQWQALRVYGLVDTYRPAAVPAVERV
ncbi:MAG: beta-mannosidase [Armatimonadota bacterium]